MNNLTDQIEQLLSQYNFDELSASEQSQVKAELGEETYRQMRSVVSGATAFSDTIPPLSADLRARIKSSSQVQQATSSTMNVKQFAIGLLLGAVSTLLLLRIINTTQEQPIQEINQAIHTDTIYVHTIDTIYQSIPSEPIIIKQEVIKYLEAPKDSTLPDISYAFAVDSIRSAQYPLASNNRQPIDSTAAAVQTPIKRGRTVGDEEALMNLLSGVRAFGIDE